MADVTLRVLGTSVTQLKVIQDAVRSDLGFSIEIEVLGGVATQQKGILRPEAYDIYDQWFHSIDLLWTAGSLQPIKIERLDSWDYVGELTKTGAIEKSVNLGAGSRPMDIQYVQDDGALGSLPSQEISAVPTVHNADSFSYDPRYLPSGCDVRAESWSWLLDKNWRGKIGLNTDPSIGIADMILAARAMNLMDFEEICNKSINEIDVLVDELIVLKQRGQFRGFWSTIQESVEFMQKSKGMIGGIWSPAAIELRARGIPIRVAAPVEGYRAWHSSLCLSSHLPPEKTDAAYSYLNWWLSGKPGAILARQGFYSSTLEMTRKCLSEAEWDYWYAGLPATEVLLDPHGRKIISKGEIREGGSYRDRMSNIVLWNTLMDEQNYLVRRWNEFLSA